MAVILRIRTPGRLDTRTSWGVIRMATGPESRRRWGGGLRPALGTPVTVVLVLRQWTEGTESTSQVQGGSPGAGWKRLRIRSHWAAPRRFHDWGHSDSSNSHHRHRRPHPAARTPGGWARIALRRTARRSSHCQRCRRPRAIRRMGCSAGSRRRQGCRSPCNTHPRNGRVARQTDIRRTSLGCSNGSRPLAFRSTAPDRRRFRQGSSWQPYRSSRPPRWAGSPSASCID